MWFIKRCLVLSFLLIFVITCSAKEPNGAVAVGIIDAGVAKIDITPYGPIRLSGYGWWRKTESQGVMQQLWAKALAIGSDKQGASVIITCDLAGIPGWIWKRVADTLSKKMGLRPEQLSICASHTHSGPDVGSSHNMYFNPRLPVDQTARIAFYLDSLSGKLETVALAALKDRKPAYLSWGQGSVGFGVNRRVIKNGKWTGHGQMPDGPVDHTLPMLKVADANGNIRGIFVSYACHGTVLSEYNKTHGDWIGDAQISIEQHHPGAIALVANACGGDQDPTPRGTPEMSHHLGEMMAYVVDSLLATPLHPLTQVPVGRMKVIQLPFDHIPDLPELVELSKDSTEKGFNAAQNIERIVRGIPLEQSMSYPVQTLTFGNQLVMVFLAGEVVIDYSLRLRKELDNSRLWINAYANDVKAYIPSRRIIPQGGYEVEGNMYYYDHPIRFSMAVEDMIIDAVRSLVPKSFDVSTAKK